MIKIGELLRKLWSLRSCFLILPPGALTPQGIEDAMKRDVSRHWCTLQWCASRGWFIAHENWTSCYVPNGVLSSPYRHVCRINKLLIPDFRNVFIRFCWIFIHLQQKSIFHDNICVCEFYLCLEFYRCFQISEKFMYSWSVLSLIMSMKIKMGEKRNSKQLGITIDNFITFSEMAPLLWSIISHSLCERAITNFAATSFINMD